MKKIILIVVPLLVLGGAFFGLAKVGVINVPGLSPKKAKPPVLYGESKDKKDEKPAEKAPEKPKQQKPPTPTKPPQPTDPEQGAKKLAGLWNSVSTDKLLEIIKQFKDNELAPVFVVMDPEKVSEVMSAMDPKRSATLSRELQKVASQIKK